jgi:hypothetical protein
MVFDGLAEDVFPVEDSWARDTVTENNATPIRAGMIRLILL